MQGTQVMDNPTAAPAAGLHSHDGADDVEQAEASDAVRGDCNPVDASRTEHDLKAEAGPCPPENSNNQPSASSNEQRGRDVLIEETLQKGSSVILDSATSIRPNKDGSLLRMFQAEGFDTYMHMFYLFHRQEQGVHDYLVNKLYRMEEEDIHFYIPQFWYGQRKRIKLS